MTKPLMSETEMAKAFDDEYARCEARRPKPTPCPRGLQDGDLIYCWDNMRHILHGPYPFESGQVDISRPELRAVVTVWQSHAHRSRGRARFFTFSEGHGDGALQWRLAEELTDDERASASVPPFDRAGIFLDPDHPRETLHIETRPEPPPLSLVE